MIVRRGSGHGARVSRTALFPNERGLPERASRSEDELRFRSLVDQHSDFVWRLLCRFGLSAADADDATQKVFMIASRRLHDIAPEHERTFLYGTARRVLSNARRTQRRRRETDGEALEAMPEERPLPDALVEQQRALSRLDALLRLLPDPLRRVLVLAEVEQTPVSEIAALEGIPSGTAASRLRRARAAFRELLANECSSGAADKERA